MVRAFCIFATITILIACANCIRYRRAVAHSWSVDTQRSPRVVIAALVLLLGVPLALMTAIVFGDGAENVLHLALAASFLLLAFAVFDFRLPTWINFAGCAATGTLGAIFFLQGASDLMHSAPLQHLAYAVLGQRVEKLLGYAFLLWCVAMLFSDSAGRTKLFGVVVLVAIVLIEIYSIVTTYAGGEAPGVLKLFYLPLFIWLLLEGMEPRDRLRPGRPSSHP